MQAMRLVSKIAAFFNREEGGCFEVFGNNYIKAEDTTLGLST